MSRREIRYRFGLALLILAVVFNSLINLAQVASTKDETQNRVTQLQDLSSKTEQCTGTDSTMSNPCIQAKAKAVEVKTQVGPDGAGGAPGRDGAPGQDGADADTAMVRAAVIEYCSGPDNPCQGPPGTPGADGNPGQGGAQGGTGPPGAAGDSVTDAQLSAAVLTYCSGPDNPCQGPAGAPGVKGEPGKAGAPGADGNPGGSGGPPAYFVFDRTPGETGGEVTCTYQPGTNVYDCV